LGYSFKIKAKARKYLALIIKKTDNQANNLQDKEDTLCKYLSDVIKSRNLKSPFFLSLI
jgi:hypothetical protein